MPCEDPLIDTTFTPRAYQEAIATTALLKNTLVVLPTGLGKTNIFLLTAVRRLQKHQGRILLLGPTRPLIDQYKQAFLEHTTIPEDCITVITGRVPPEKRKALYTEARVILATPQVIENDLISRSLTLQDVVLLGIDEAHRAVGKYSYVWIAQRYLQEARLPRIIALTASPGAEEDRIREVIINLHLEAIEVRTPSDPDVKPYIQPVKTHTITVTFPGEFKSLQKIIQRMVRERRERISQLTGSTPPEGRGELISFQQQLREQADTPEAYEALSILAELLKIAHAGELLESQGLNALKTYLEDLEREAQKGHVKATKNLLKDPHYSALREDLNRLLNEGKEHPKIAKTLELVRKLLEKDPDTTMILFTSYRDTAHHLHEKLREIPGARPVLFFGQAKKRGHGLSQKEQKHILTRFRQGEYNILISTSIGEEGLDLPSVDVVVFYEPVPSAIRTIQRRGRTGRHAEGSVIILATKGTRDEAYLWSAKRKEKRMHDLLQEFKRKTRILLPPPTPQKQEETILDKPVIIADARERQGSLLKSLAQHPVDIKLVNLPVGDYQVSDRVIIEVKTLDDFIQSILDGRLLQQARQLKEQADRPVMLIITPSIQPGRVQQNALLGAMASITIDFGIPIITLPDADTAARYILLLAKREQFKQQRTPHLHPEKRRRWSLPEIQEYITASLPGIGSTLNKPLLKRFQTLRALFNATANELSRVEGIGPVRAAELEAVFTTPYTPSTPREETRTEKEQSSHEEKNSE